MKGMAGRFSIVGVLGAALGVINSDASAQEPELLATADWLAARAGDPGVVVLHADSRVERYEDGHLPGARFLDMGRLAWDGNPAVGVELRTPHEIEAALEEAGVDDRHRHVVVYGDDPLVAARAFMTLEVVGLRGRVRMLDGGLIAWRAEGRPLERGASPVTRGSLTLGPGSDILVGADWIADRLDAPGLALVDARPDAEYTGSNHGGGARSGHIPGGVQMYWEGLIESREMPRLRPADELRALFGRAGADAGDTVVAYCAVGLRASFTYFVSRLLGYDTRFYDGSWQDWAARDDLPFVTGRSPR